MLTTNYIIGSDNGPNEGFVLRIRKTSSALHFVRPELFRTLVVVGFVLLFFRIDRVEKSVVKAFLNEKFIELFQVSIGLLFPHLIRYR